MTVENIRVDDADSLDAAADLLDTYFAALDRHNLCSYDRYLDQLNDQLNAENGDADDTDEYHWSLAEREESPNDGNYLTVIVRNDDPEPPQPGAPLLALAPIACTVCHGFGVHAMVPPTAASGRPCWYCGGCGEEPYPDITPTTPFNDRVEHLRRIGQTGGMTTYSRYGSGFYRTIGKAGYQAAVAKHGEPYVKGILAAKGWQPRKPDLLADLKTGRQLAELDRIAA